MYPHNISHFSDLLNQRRQIVLDSGVLDGGGLAPVAAFRVLFSMINRYI